MLHGLSIFVISKNKCSFYVLNAVKALVECVNEHYQSYKIGVIYKMIHHRMKMIF